MTLEEVAKRAGVSTSTVSRALNNSQLVRSATRKRVMEAVRELKYHPNVHARALAGAKSRTLGMIVSNLENPYFLDIFASVQKRAEQNGYEVLVESTSYRQDRLVESVRSMLGHRLLGLSVVVSEMDEDLIEDLTSRDLPVVFHDVGYAAHNASHISIDFRKPMEKAVEYLYSLGHRRMAFVGHHVGLSSLQARRQGFLETMQRYSGEVEFATDADIDGPEGGRRVMRRLLASGFRATAVLCVNDFMALGVLRELREQGLQVPRDVSVTGFDNIHLAEFAFPSLTTVNVPRQEIGRLIFETLVPPQGPPAVGQETVVAPELVVRDSTGPAPS